MRGAYSLCVQLYENGWGLLISLIGVPVTVYVDELCNLVFDSYGRKPFDIR